MQVASRGWLAAGRRLDDCLGQRLSLKNLALLGRRFSCGEDAKTQGTSATSLKSLIGALGDANHDAQRDLVDDGPQCGTVPWKLIRRPFVMELCRGPAGDGTPFTFGFASTTPAWTLSRCPPGTWDDMGDPRYNPPSVLQIARLPLSTNTEQTRILRWLFSSSPSSHFSPSLLTPHVCFRSPVLALCFASSLGERRVRELQLCAARDLPRLSHPSSNSSAVLANGRAASSRCGTQHAIRRWST
jgi:hypothetical protein